MGLCLMIPGLQHETAPLQLTREKKTLSETYLPDIPTAFSEHWGVIPNPSPSDPKTTLNFKYTSNRSPTSLQVCVALALAHNIVKLKCLYLWVKK